ncbi:MAG: four helix bundle protein [Bacteroidota bacterium]
MKENIIKKLSYEFAIEIVSLYKLISKDKNEYILSKQILRSGTSIGALVREAEQAESKADFIHKLAIALKEANETSYWLDLLKDTEYITETTYLAYKNDIDILLKLLVSIIKTSKKNNLSIINNPLSIN